MGERGDEEQLLSFLNAVLKPSGVDKLVSVEILEGKTLPPEVIGDKKSILDLRARTNDGSLVNVEVQLRNLRNMDKRSLFYASREFGSGIDAGQDYIELPRVIAINIVDFEFIPEETISDFHTCFHLWEDRHKDYMLTNALEIHFIDIPKFRRLPVKNIVEDRLLQWITFFDKETTQETLEEVLRMDAAIQKAHEKMTLISGDKEAMRYYHMREKALFDFTSGMNSARREGREEGLAEGKKEGKKEGLAEGKKEGKREGNKEGKEEMVRNMKAGGLSVEHIMRFSGFSREEIEAL
jgi:predicted transposase/invertase (TIGR01784 family)